MYHLQNPVNGLAPFRVLVPQLVDHSPGVRKVMGSNPIGDSDIFSEFMYVSTIPLKHNNSNNHHHHNNNNDYNNDCTDDADDVGGDNVDDDDGGDNNSNKFEAITYPSSYFVKMQEKAVIHGELRMVAPLDDTSDHKKQSRAAVVREADVNLRGKQAKFEHLDRQASQVSRHTDVKTQACFFAWFSLAALLCFCIVLLKGEQYL